jgi:hypothetical protein
MGGKAVSLHVCGGSVFIWLAAFNTRLDARPNQRQEHQKPVGCRSACRASPRSVDLARPRSVDMCGLPASGNPTTTAWAFFWLAMLKYVIWLITAQMSWIWAAEVAWHMYVISLDLHCARHIFPAFYVGG